VQLAGDAKEEFDPIGGMGMSHALRSGIEAADAIINQQNCSVEMLSRRQKEDPEAHAMRIFTALSYHTLVGAKRFPFLLSLAASRVGSGVLKFATKELV
jgi:flavin-dependent dehydrogenase